MWVADESRRVSDHLLKVDSPALWLAAEFELEIEDAHEYEFAYQHAGMNFFYLASIFSQIVLRDSEFWFIKLDTTIWRSGEDQNLVNRFCEAIGIGDSIPVRVPIGGCTTDGEDLRSLVHMSMLFGWDTAIIGTSSVLVFEHDGVAVVYSSKDAAHALAEDGVELEQMT